VETFQAPNATGLPGEAELTAKIEKMAADLSALRKAPVTVVGFGHGSFAESAEVRGHLFDFAELTAKIEKMAADLSALRKAPVAEPYDGPALLSGRAAAVFFHEVLGHRLEGHRQRDEEE